MANAAAVAAPLGGLTEIFGYAGNDMTDAGPGNDILWGSDGDDTLNGGLGDDVLTATA